jgi:hypothetical protein
MALTCRWRSRPQHQQETSALRRYRTCRSRTFAFQAPAPVETSVRLVVSLLIHRFRIDHFALLDQYRKNAGECLDQAAQARSSEDIEDALLLVAEVWLRLAVQSEVAELRS